MTFRGKKKILPNNGESADPDRCRFMESRSGFLCPIHCINSFVCELQNLSTICAEVHICTKNGHARIVSRINTNKPHYIRSKSTIYSVGAIWIPRIHIDPRSRVASLNDLKQRHIGAP